MNLKFQKCDIEGPWVIDIEGPYLKASFVFLLSIIGWALAMVHINLMGVPLTNIIIIIRLQKTINLHLVAAPKNRKIISNN